MISEIHENAVIYAEMLWEFCSIEPFDSQQQRLKKMDAVVTLGSSYLQVAEYAANIASSKLTETIVFSGNRGPNTMLWDKTEAEVFAERAESLGFKGRKILETRSNNTGDNIKNSFNDLKEAGIEVKSLGLIGLPPVKRRILAIAQKILPNDIEVSVLAPNLKIRDFDQSKLYPILRGEIDRLQRYSKPPFEFQSPVEIPKFILNCDRLLDLLGYPKR